MDKRKGYRVLSWIEWIGVRGMKISQPGIFRLQLSNPIGCAIFPIARMVLIHQVYESTAFPCNLIQHPSSMSKTLILEFGQNRPNSYPKVFFSFNKLLELW